MEKRDAVTARTFNKRGEVMIQQKALLVDFITDALQAYDLLVGTMSKERERQVITIGTICAVSRFDVAIKRSVAYMITEIEQSLIGWFSRKESRLANMLKEALNAYDEIQEVNQSLLVQATPEALPRISIAAQHSVIVEESDEFFREVLAIEGP